jgi:hypothetical protein
MGWWGGPEVRAHIKKDGEGEGGEGEVGERERGGVGEGERPKMEERTEGRMIRAKKREIGEGPRMVSRTG